MGAAGDLVAVERGGPPRVPDTEMCPGVTTARCVTLPCLSIE